MLTFWLTARGFARAFTIAPLNRASLSALDESDLRMGSALLSLNRGIAAASSVALVASRHLYVSGTVVRCRHYPGLVDGTAAAARQEGF